jgi:hypothetical protein
MSEGEKPAETIEPKPEELLDEHPLSLLLFSWMRGREFDRLLMALVAAACAVLGALAFLIDRHPRSLAEELPVFFGLFGFAAFGLTVLSGWPLGRALRRPEDYYEPAEKPPETPDA